VATRAKYVLGQAHLVSRSSTWSNDQQTVEHIEIINSKELSLDFKISWLVLVIVRKTKLMEATVYILFNGMLEKGPHVVLLVVPSHMCHLSVGLPHYIAPFRDICIRLQGHVYELTEPQVGKGTTPNRFAVAVGLDGVLGQSYY